MVGGLLSGVSRRVSDVYLGDFGEARSGGAQGKRTR